MNVYVIKQDQSKTPIPFISAFPKDEAIPNSIIKECDHTYFYDYHGVDITTYEIQNHCAHINIWQHFLLNSKDDTCLVLEDGVQLNLGLEELQLYLSDIPESWELFFPYDKISAEGRKNIHELSASKFGFFWGSYCYLLKKDGAQKMLNSDTIIQPVDEELIQKSFSGQLESIIATTDWFKYDESTSPSYIHRNKSIKEAIFSHQAWERKQKKEAVAIMQYLSSLAEKMNIDLFLHAGTLLGGVRHNGIMPWDDDIDLMMNAKDIDTFIQEVKEQGIVEHCTWVWPKTEQEYHKFWFKTGKKTEGFPYLFPFIDIWILTEKENNKIHTCDGYHFIRDVFYPAKPCLFEGCNLKLPNNYLHILDIKYPEWRTRIKVFSWSHQLKEGAFKPLSLAIKVDESGRYIDLN